MNTNSIKIVLVIVFGGLLSFNSSAQGWKDKLKKESDKATAIMKKGSSPLSEDEIVKGLKEALNKGAKGSAEKAAKLDGFNKNEKIRIPFPEEAIKVKNTAEKLGMKPQVDKFTLTLNRAAEEAAKEAAPIFINAITSMSVGDGLSILKGNKNAATQYLQNTTNPQLVTIFLPIVKSAIEKVELTKYWTPLISKYNKASRFTGGKKVNPDLNQYVTDKAISGLFVLIAEEELKIRDNPLARTTDLLKKVFGSNDKGKN